MHCRFLAIITDHFHWHWPTLFYFPLKHRKILSSADVLFKLYSMSVKCGGGGEATKMNQAREKSSERARHHEM